MNVEVAVRSLNGIFDFVIGEDLNLEGERIDNKVHILMKPEMVFIAYE